MWQVFKKVSDGWESWDQLQEGEVFDTEEAAEKRVVEMEAFNPWPEEFFFVKEE